MIAGPGTCSQYTGGNVQQNSVLLLVLYPPWPVSLRRPCFVKLSPPSAAEPQYTSLKKATKQLHLADAESANAAFSATFWKCDTPGHAWSRLVTSRRTVLTAGAYRGDPGQEYVVLSSLFHRSLNPDFRKEQLFTSWAARTTRRK